MAAIELIERSEDVARLGIYHRVQLDLHRRGLREGRTSSAHLDEIVAISKAAVASFRDRLVRSDQDKRELADLLVDLAASTLPDLGGETRSHRQVGLDAARFGVDLWMSLGNAVGTGRAHRLVARHHQHAGAPRKAEAHLRKSIECLAPTGARDELDWSRALLGLLQLAQGRDEGRELWDQARSAFASRGNLDAIRDLDWHAGRAR